MKICSVWVLRYDTLHSVILGDLKVWFISLSFPYLNLCASMNVNDSLVCTRESEREERWDSWQNIKKHLSCKHLCAFLRGPKSHDSSGKFTCPPPPHTHREKIAKREKSANISIAFPMASVQSWSESGFSEKGWVSLRTSSALSKTYSYVERSPNAVVVMLK